MTNLLEIKTLLDKPGTATASLVLPFETRQKSRFRATLDNQQEVGVFLPRGIILRDGDCLQAENGMVIRISAAAESVSEAHTDDSLLLARACYHLGNRHVPLQIATGWLRYLHDHVLDDMVASLGLSVSQCMAPFEPEPGAYHSHAHAHHHHD